MQSRRPGDHGHGLPADAAPEPALHLLRLSSRPARALQSFYGVPRGRPEPMRRLLPAAGRQRPARGGPGLYGPASPAPGPAPEVPGGPGLQRAQVPLRLCVPPSPSPLTGLRCGRLAGCSQAGAGAHRSRLGSLCTPRRRWSAQTWSYGQHRLRHPPASAGRRLRLTLPACAAITIVYADKAGLHGYLWLPALRPAARDGLLPLVPAQPLARGHVRGGPCRRRSVSTRLLCLLHLSCPAGSRWPVLAHTAWLGCAARPQLMQKGLPYQLRQPARPVTQVPPEWRAACRFLRNPFVAVPEASMPPLRSYAGCPLVGSTGQRLGTL